MIARLEPRAPLRDGAADRPHGDGRRSRSCCAGCPGGRRSRSRLAALVFNLFLLPRLRVNLYRPGDRERGVHGIIWYPLAVLLLLVTFPRRPDIVAAAWGILAIGDGVATLAGRAIGGPRWPWNREKTLSGSAAFAIGGAAAGVFLAWWCRPALASPPALAFTIARADPRGDRRRARRNDSGPARRQPVGRGDGRRRDVAGVAGVAGATARPRWPSATATAAGRARAQRRRRVGRPPRAHRVGASGAIAGAIIGITIFVGARLAGLGAAARHVRRRVDRVAARPEAQDAARHRGGARRTPRRRATRSPIPAWRRSPP